MTIFNVTQNAAIANRVYECKSIWSRLLGLLGLPKLNQDEACLLHRCNGIHTFGMRYEIDACFLDKSNRVIAIEKNIKPNRISKIYPKSRSTLEFLGGSLSAACKSGDQLRIDHESAHSQNRASSSKGQSMVEFAIAITLFVVLIFGIIDAALTVYSKSILQLAINHALRNAIPQRTTLGDIKQDILTKLADLGYPQNSSEYALTISDISGTTFGDMNNAAVQAQVLPPASYVIIDMQSRQYLRWTETSRDLLLRLVGVSISGRDMSAKTLGRTEYYDNPVMAA